MRPTLSISQDAGFRRYVAEIERYPRLDREAELRLARRYVKRGDRSAADALVQSNLRYVVKIAGQYRGYGMRVADLVAEGNLGLLEAVRRFDPARNLRFMTYAAYWIRAFILSHVLKQWSMVGVGTGPLQSKLFFRLARERSRIADLAATEPTPAADSPEVDVDAQLARTFQTSTDRIRQMAGRLEGRDASLDAALFQDGEATLLDTIRDDRPSQEEQTATAERAARVRACVAIASKDFDARERLILRERLLVDDDAVTLADLGRRLGLSRERVRQLEERVLRKLRRALEPMAAEAARAA